MRRRRDRERRRTASVLGANLEAAAPPSRKARARSSRRAIRRDARRRRRRWRGSGDEVEIQAAIRQAASSWACGMKRSMNAGAQPPGLEVRFVEDLELQRHRGLDALDDRHLERSPHARDRLLPVAAVHDDLGDHRVVVRRHRALGVRERVDADARTARHAERVNHAGRRRERLRDPRR